MSYCKILKTKTTKALILFFIFVRASDLLASKFPENYTHQNSAYNACAVLAVKFSLNISSDGIEKALGLTKQLNGDCSIEDIANFCSKNNLNSSKISSIKLSDLFEAPNSAVYVLPYQEGSTWTYIILSKRNNQFFIDSYPKLDVNISPEKLKTAYLDSLKPPFLLVAKGGKNTFSQELTLEQRRNLSTPENDNVAIKQNNPNVIKNGVLEEGEIIDLGVVPRIQKIIKTKYTIKNISDQIVYFKKIRGSCSCFIKADYKTSQLPGSTQVMEFYFDTKKYLEAPNIETSVGFEYETADKKQFADIINVRGEFDKDEFIFLDPSLLDLGKCYSIPDIKINLYKKIGRKKSIDIKSINITKGIVTYVRVKKDEAIKLGSFIQDGFVSIKFKESELEKKRNEIKLTIYLNDPLYDQLSSFIYITR
ncbi:MAG: DUF1573 domain-containing protein [Verrucomicrobiales bacterium]|jgi:hypothetical protein|nr:DUF1573 domain-containing protein [Verrucomicrobiales bacterium]